MFRAGCLPGKVGEEGARAGCKAGERTGKGRPGKSSGGGGQCQGWETRWGRRVSGLRLPRSEPHLRPFQEKPPYSYFRAPHPRAPPGAPPQLRVFPCLSLLFSASSLGSVSPPWPWESRTEALRFRGGGDRWFRSTAVWLDSSARDLWGGSRSSGVRCLSGKGPWDLDPFSRRCQIR